jgi:hypothetical protein
MNKPPCWACGGKGRSGPNNEVCHCVTPKAVSVKLDSQPPHACPKCWTTWSKTMGTFSCPLCGYDIERGEWRKFHDAHAHVKGIVAGSPSSDPEPEPEPKKINPDDWSDLNWSVGYI